MGKVRTNGYLTKKGVEATRIGPAELWAHRYVNIYIKTCHISGTVATCIGLLIAKGED